LVASKAETWADQLVVSKVYWWADQKGASRAGRLAEHWAVLWVVLKAGEMVVPWVV
jgi:hypothetical protein